MEKRYGFIVTSVFFLMSLSSCGQSNPQSPMNADETTNSAQTNNYDSSSISSPTSTESASYLTDSANKSTEDVASNEPTTDSSGDVSSTTGFSEQTNALIEEKSANMDISGAIGQAGTEQMVAEQIPTENSSGEQTFSWKNQEKDSKSNVMEDEFSSSASMAATDSSTSDVSSAQEAASSASNKDQAASSQRDEVPMDKFSEDAHTNDTAMTNPTHSKEMFGQDHNGKKEEPVGNWNVPSSSSTDEQAAASSTAAAAETKNQENKPIAQKENKLTEEKEDLANASKTSEAKEVKAAVKTELKDKQMDVEEDGQTEQKQDLANTSETKETQKEKIVKDSASTGEKMAKESAAPTDDGQTGNFNGKVIFFNSAAAQVTVKDPNTGISRTFKLKDPDTMGSLSNGDSVTIVFDRKDSSVALNITPAGRI